MKNMTKWIAIGMLVGTTIACEKPEPKVEETTTVSSSETIAPATDSVTTDTIATDTSATVIETPAADATATAGTTTETAGTTSTTATDGASKQ